MKLTKAPETRGIADPVLASFTEGTLRYYDGMGQNASPRVCDRPFAETMLAALETWAAEYGFAYVEHLGIYNYRRSRTAGGKALKTMSLHAYGRAIDWTGIVTSDGKRISVGTLISGAPKKIKRLKELLGEHSIEWLDKYGGRWIHIGLRR